MGAMRPERARRRAGLLALACVGVAYVTLMQPLGWNQTSHFALVKALAHGTPRIDRYQWETGDKSYTGGHFYSVKAPGTAALALPWYEALRALGAPSALGGLAARPGGARWRGAAIAVVKFKSRGARKRAVARTVARETPLVWALDLAVVVAPALVLLALVRSLAEGLEPGLGTAAAVALGLGTLVLPFATMLFSHVLAAALAFASFALLWRQRAARARALPLLAAGVLAGVGIVVEYPIALIAGILALYAAASRPRVRRALAFVAGAVAGVLPLVAYNLWAFGSVTALSYRDAVKFPGRTGHDVLGLNASGLFGVDWPRLHAGLTLLVSGRGLLVLTPVVAMGAVGAVLLYRRGRRAEALTIGAVALAFLLYNSGYYLPFGGNSPGPRFLLAALPFLALPLAVSFRRFPAPTVALTLASVTTMVLATVTRPQIASDATGRWLSMVERHHFTPTVVSALGTATGWLAMAPFVAAAVGALALAAVASPRLRLAGPRLGLGVAAAAAWALAAIALPPAIGSSTRHGHATGSTDLILVALGVALVGLGLFAVLARRPALPPRAGRRAPAAAG
jgi:hypothetical protein